MIKIIIGVCVATLIGIIAFTFIPKITSSETTPDETTVVDDTNKMTIGISGEVVRPGNYILEEGATMQDLIDKAGGTNNNADERAYYANAEIEMNQEYYIAPKYDVKDVCAETPIEKININDADKETLMTVSGFGDAISTQILQYRNDNGIFYTLESLMDVNGIGNATFSKVRDYIYLHE